MLIILCRYSSIRYPHITENIKKNISVKDAEIIGAIVATDRQVWGVESALGELFSRKGPRMWRTKSGHLSGLTNNRLHLVLRGYYSKSSRPRLESSLFQQLQVKVGNQNASLQIGINNGPISGISFGEGEHEFLQQVTEDSSTYGHLTHHYRIGQLD